MPLEAVEPRRLYRQVADQLRQLIDDGEFAVGTRLPTERELAEQLGISRPTVREALIALEVEGRVRIRVGSGIYVTGARPAAETPSAPARQPDGPFEILRARAFVEGAIAEEAARLATAADLARIDAVFADMGDGNLPPDVSIRHDRAFHLAVTATLSNAVLDRIVGELFDERINPYFAQLAGYFENAESWRAAFAEHRAIRDAIAAHDAAAAGTAMRRHLTQSQERFSQSFGGAAATPSAGPVKKQRPA